VVPDWFWVVWSGSEVVLSVWSGFGWVCGGFSGFVMVLRRGAARAARGVVLSDVEWF
jgi:hypothetical protein